MENYQFRNVTFTYPEQEKPALSDLNFTVSSGEFVIICGPSGCGKSTLLRHLKTTLTPHGKRSGDILYHGTPLADVPFRTQSQEIGFVLQSPENQVVTDKVWHELAFGLESLGYDNSVIRRRVAEIAAFFGIEGWFYKNVSDLSGGQKQLLSLASIMAMQPSVLVLDEPTAQLDPIAAADFLALLGKINRELGLTVILTEHRLEEAFPYATRVMVMDRGKVVCDDAPETVGIKLRDKGNGMFLAMPTAMRVWAGVKTQLPCPVTVRDGSRFLTEFSAGDTLQPIPEEVERNYPDGVVLEADDLWFRYEKDAPDVVKGLSLQLKKGQFYALLGGNGAGKTTSLKILAGLRKAYRGEVKACGRIVLLPQNPQTLFVKRTVREDLQDVVRHNQKDRESRDQMITWVSNICDLRELLDRHPYDLSGGEQQRAALAKVLLMQPDILLLDEPTKGLDAEFKVAFAGILRKLTCQGVTILMVSHDVSFCAEYAHRCGLFFDGSVVAEGTPREFFSGNSFYTTSANRMARHLLDKAVTVDDIITACGGECRKEEVEEQVQQLLPEPKATSAGFKPKPLPLWRKLLAVLSGGAAIYLFLYATSIADLTQLITREGMTSLAKSNLWMNALFVVALIVFALSIGRRAAPPVQAQTPTDKRKLDKRTVVAAVLILLLIPLTIFGGIVYLGDRHYNIISLAVLAECMIPFILVFEGRKPKPRELVTIAVLCAIGVAGRSAFFMLPQFKPVMALTIVAGVAFGGETGFLVGAVTMLVSNILFSQGPWTPWQMFSMGIIGFIAGVLFRKGFLRRTRGSLATFGAIAAIVVYGGIMNFASVIMWSSTINWSILLTYYITGFPMDLIHASATAIFLILAAEPMLEKLDRIKVKYGLVES